MENAVRANPEGRITYKGREYPIKITMGVLNQFEQETGRDAFTSGWQSSSRATTALIRACLMRNNKALERITIEDVANEMSIPEWTDAMREINRLITESAPAPEVGEKKEIEAAPEEAKAA